MVMKVDNIHSVLFKGGINTAKQAQTDNTRPQITELSNVTPDFGVTVPQKYTKLGVKKLDNGLEVHMYKLANGHKVSIIPMEGSPAVVKNYVNVGSMNETANIKGISHFLEHMAFNGTNGENGHIKLEAGDSFKKIDELGGWANASTNYAITDYVNSTPLLNKKDLEQQIKIIAAMSEDLKLSTDMIEKEKHPVSSEINMILDDPQTIALDQTVRTLFKIKNPADEMVGGSVKTIKNLTRKDLIDYYNKYYTPDNMNLVITGDVNPDEAINITAKSFNSRKISQGAKFEEKLSPIQKTERKDFVSDKAKSTEVILGFAGPKNNDIREKVIYDIAQTYLNSYSSGLTQNLKQYNAYPYIDSEKISTNPNAARMVYLAASVSEDNSEKLLKTIFDTISSVKAPDRAVLDEIKQRILKAKEETFEYSSEVNDIIGKAMLNNSLEYITDYEQILNSITPEEVHRGVKQYFDLNKAAVTVVHPKKDSAITFKGKREPVNVSRISEYQLPNGFDTGLYETKSSNINYNISLYIDKPYNQKAGVINVLDYMYTMGNSSLTEDEMDIFQEKNNITLASYVSPARLKISTESSFNNRNLIFDNAKKLLYEPRFTEENLKKAKQRIKDHMSRHQDSAYRLYANYDTRNNPYDFSDEEILANLDNITLDDVKECHKYLLNNSRGIITANIPAEHPEVKNEILNSSAKLKKVLPNKIKPLEIYKENTRPKVLQVVKNNSQADIMQVYKFKTDNTLRESVLGELTNSILTSSSIGLFDNLREKDHLAYSVYSTIEKTGNSGEISCNILTTTDNKDIGEISYDNVKKSIDGFNRQIAKLKAGEFSDKDLENAKLAMKANLLNTEGSSKKLDTINLGLNSKYGITYANKLYNEIDTITKQEIVDFAEKIFHNPPVYSIAASKDTLVNNKDYFKTLEA